MENKVKNLLFYVAAVFIDTMSFYLIFYAAVGANSFGIMAGNLVLLIPISIGLANVLYDIFNVTASSILTKKRIRVESLLYGFIFAGMYELLIIFMPDIQSLHLIFRSFFFLFGLMLADLAKAMLNLSKLPPLSSALFIYSISERFKISLNWASKIANVNKIFWGIMFSVIAGVPFNLVGVGTVLSIILAGIFLKAVDPYVKKFYTKYIGSKKHIEEGSSK